MKNLLKRRGLAALALAAMPLFAAAADAPIIIKFSYTIAPDTPKGKAVARFKELVEKRTAGKVRIDVFPNAALYKDKEEVEALQLGAVQMLAPAVSKFGPMGVREFEAFDLPYLFDSGADLSKVLEGPIGTSLLKKLDNKGLTGLAYWTAGFRGLCAKKLLVLPTDAKGLKFRIPSSKVLDSEIRAIGGMPQVLASSEVYQALQTGVVDGAEVTPSNMYTQKLYEVQPNFVATNHSALVYAVVINRKFWLGLPKDVQTAIESSMKEATAYGNSLSDKDNEDALAAIKKSGRTKVQEPAPQERLAWKKAWMPVHAEQAPKIGAELLDSIYKTTGFDPMKL